MKSEEIDARHGGQVWYTNNHVIEDLSVTANPFGLPNSSLQFLAENLSLIEYYPPNDWEPTRGRLFEFLGLNKQPKASSSQLLLGNGASELIDVLLRYLRSSGAQSYFPGPSVVQYKEYEKTARLYGMRRAESRHDTDIHLLVNPNNPTGSFLSYQALRSYICEFAKVNSVIVVDESMLPWLGSEWTSESLLSDVSWIYDLENDFAIRVFVIYSWTKFWSCCGLRIGSLWCPSEQTASCVREMLIPWNVSALALSFLQTAVSDVNYLLRTWKETRLWRARLCIALQSACNGWIIYGEDWLPWIWLDVLQPTTASKFVEASVDCGLPVRSGSIGYKQSSFIRMRVCSLEHQEILFRALRKHRIIS